jgi:flagellar hook protein FlgE
MGIFGALTNAVTGLRAQSYALENISGNIANSQTTAFKRVDTSFEDLIPDTGVTKQLAGSVVASSRATNSVQGDIQSSSIGTFMAINGEGFFVVQKPSNFVDNRPVFDGADVYTRRGDFQLNKDGYLVNAAGNYLMGIAVDPTTGNLVGSTPELLQFKNDFLPAQATTQIQYRANLASYPLTSAHDANVPGSELLNPATFTANPLVGAPAVAKITGFDADVAPDAVAVKSGNTDISGLSSAGGTLVLNATNVNIAASANAAAVVSAINAQTGTTGISAALDGSNHLKLTTANADTNIAIGGASTLAVLNELGLAAGTTNATNLLTQSKAAAGQTLTVQVSSGAVQTVTFGSGGGQVSTLAELNAQLAGLSGVLASTDGDGNISLSATNAIDTLNVGGTATLLNFGVHTTSALPADQTVHGNDVTTFLDQSIGGGEITAYDQSGSPVNIQLRWAKTASAATGGTDTWQLFYQENASATGNAVAWRNAGMAYAFAANGKMNPAVSNVTLNNVTVNGVALGTVQIVHGADGVTQFADANGTAKVNLLQQNGYAAGELQSIAVNDKGRITGSYSNGRTIDLADITLASFNGPDMLKRIDGGAFQATDGSGTALLGAPGKIVGSSLEGSNTDIADEFTKLIVTQQAYSANTRVVTTSDQMVQDLLNMLR